MNPGELIGAVRTVKQRALPQQESLDELTAVLSAFVADPVNRSVELPQITSGLYTRSLLNSIEDDFQIVVVSWGPGSGSPIHDHNDTVGAVAALVGTTLETKHQIIDRNGSTVQLKALDTLRLHGELVTPILPDEETQLHDMVNHTDEWAATIHVYLTAIMEFRTYDPNPNGSFTVNPRKLWFDVDQAWRHWPALRTSLAA